MLFLLFSLYISMSINRIIEEGVYSIIFNNIYLQYYRRKILFHNSLKYPNTYFRIKNIYNNNKFYFIEELITRFKLSYVKEKDLIFKKEDNNTSWNFVNIKNNIYIIINKNGCYIKISYFHIVCENTSIEKATQFEINKIFEEIKVSKRENEIIEKEPIDVLIKYIDLRDPELKRSGIFQLEKDFDNEELKYSLRSIIRNIPWIRKIFILMPNEKVRFLKDDNIINDKIVYVKDKDFLGYDSSNSLAFQFRLWKMKNFGISDNFIVMDDDCFIGRKLKKSDFFYVKDNNVVPAIISTKFLKIDKNTSQIKYDFYKAKALSSGKQQNSDIFFYSNFLTQLFILRIFNINKSIFIPRFTHNAIPVNINELIYNFIK